MKSETPKQNNFQGTINVGCKKVDLKNCVTVEGRNSNHTKQDVKRFPEKCFCNWIKQHSTGLMHHESAQDTE